MASLASIATTQLSGLTGRRIKIPYNSALISKIPAADEAYKNSVALKKQQEEFEANQALQERNAETQKDQANKASVIQGTNTALTLATLTKDAWWPAVKSLAGSAKNALQSVAQPVIDKITGTAAEKAAEEAAKIAAEKAAAETAVEGVSNLAGGAAKEGIKTAAEIAAEEAAKKAAIEGTMEGANLVGGATPVSSTLGSIVGGLGSVASYAPYVAAAKELGTLTRQWTGDTGPDKGTKMDYFSRTGRVAENADLGLLKPLQHEIGGQPDWMQELNDKQMDVTNPGGYVMGAIKRAGWCGIIMSAIHGADSPEVDLCRKYRDKFLTDEQLRGYYVFAEPVCFIMDKHPAMKGYFRKYLTDSFVDYAGYKLREKTSRPSLRSTIISKLFLRFCAYLGRKVPTYTRLNGEVY